MARNVLTRALVASLIAAAFTAAPAQADQVILDDLIVDGSLCAGGPDCVDGEYFGFDTLRLKNSSPRLTFTDTSTSASFPTTDWQLAANGDAEGSGNFFAFSDLDAGTSPLRILGGAPTDSLVLEPDGNLRLGSGPLTQRTGGDGIENVTPADGDAILAALQSLPISSFEYVADTADLKHIGPNAADFNATFGVGSGTEQVAVSDLAGVALAAAQRVGARVIDLTGPRGPQGPQGPAGAKGDTGPQGAAAKPSDGLAASLKRIAKIARNNRKLARANKKLNRRVKALNSQVRKLKASR